MSSSFFAIYDSQVLQESVTSIGLIVIKYGSESHNNHCSVSVQQSPDSPLQLTSAAHAHCQA